MKVANNWRGGETFKSAMNKKGFTLVELLVVIAIIGVLVGVVAIAINPAEMLKKSRDAKRLSDIASVRKAIDLALANGGALNAALCTTAAPCSSASGTRAVDGSGWVSIDVSKYLATLPIDPRAADTTYTDAAGASVNAEYKYANDGTSYELEAHLESTSNAHYYTEDGGNATGWYELGTKLTIL